MHNQYLDLAPAMRCALQPMFRIEHESVSAYNLNLLIDGTFHAGTVSFLLENSLVIDANYLNLNYDETTRMWWVDLTGIQLHDDPQQFEDE